jgi:hypothetical protein
MIDIQSQYREETNNLSISQLIFIIDRTGIAKVNPPWTDELINKTSVDNLTYYNDINVFFIYNRRTGLSKKHDKSGVFGFFF